MNDAIDDRGWLTPLDEASRALLASWPSLAGIILVLLALWGLHWYLVVRGGAGSAEQRFPRLLGMLLATALALLLVVLMLPVSDATRGQLLGLFGVALTAIIAIASTSFVANIMAGLMLRIVRSYRPGDFLRVESHFGRVSDRGLFHTEIQTEDGDLTTLPNLFIATHPVTVIRSSGTIVSATVSLGYDLDHRQIRELLSAAAADAGLSDPFVQLRELGDFSVTYRVAGMLDKVNTLLTARSKLREAMLDRLHGADIEIVSPTFMNQRQLGPEQRFLAAVSARREADRPAGKPAEDIVFDKAAEAEKLEALRDQLRRLKAARDALDGADVEDRESQRETLAKRIDLLERALERSGS